MATTVDERIVAAKFDASDFEKGVNKTIKKLDELKKSLDLKEATKGVKELAEKTEVSTNSMSNSLEKLTDRFTNFTGMIKQKILGGLADEVANVFLRMEQAVKGFITSISTQQIGAGMQKYQAMLTSVRQMVNAGYDQDRVYDVLERTQEYTDETSYSFEQMTDAMSKMVAAGVDLDVAAKNVEGIANACANAGINATDASRAFYNLSQAFSSGKLHYTDYRSLELLNLTTKEFKEQMLEAGVAAQTLEKKTDKAGNTIYKTSNKVDKKVKAGKTVNEKNLSEMLRYDWMNTEAMNQLFGSAYWMSVIDKDELAKLRRELGDAEFEKRFGKIASQAYQAAYEARSFTDVINALKDAVSSGWSKTFQHLFGKLEEAKNFFTDLANGELADAIYKIGEWRNTILEAWNMPTITGEGVGGSAFRQTILNLTDILGMLFKAMLNVFGGFDELDEDGKDGQKTLKSMGERLAIITVEIRNATYELKKWLTDPVTKGGPTRIEMLSQAFKNLGAVFGIIGKVIGVAFKALGRVFNLLAPIFDGFLVLLNKITEPFVKLRDESTVFKDMENSVDNIYTILKPIADILGEVVGFLGDVAAFFISMAIDTATANISFFADVLGLLLELFTGSSAQKLEDGEGVLGKIRKDFEGIKEACASGLSALKEFFGALISDIRKLLGLSDEKDMDQNGGFFTNVVNFFNTNEFVKSAKKWIDKAIVDIGNFIKSIPSRLVNLGFNIYDAIRGLFFKDVTKYNGSMLETKTELTPLGQWVDKLIKDIKEWFVNLPQRIIDGVGKALNWINNLFDYLFGKRTVKNVIKTDGSGNKGKEYESEIWSRFDEFVVNAITAVRNWFRELPNKIKTAWKNIGNFATNLWNIIDEFLFGKKVTSTKNVKGKNGKTFQQSAANVTTRYKTGFSKFLDTLVKEIKKFIKKIPEYIKKAISGAGDIITMILNALFGKGENNKEVTNKDVEKGLEKPFLGINLTNILNSIKEIGATLLNNIAKIFTGTDDAEKNAEWFAETIAKGIRWIRDKAMSALAWVLDFLVDIPATISAYFKGESKNNAEAGPVGKAILEFGSTIGHFIIEDLPTAILRLIDGAVDLFDTVWNALYDKITEGADEAAGEAADKQGNKEPSGLAKLVEKIKTTFINVFQHLPEWVAKGLDMAVIGIQNILENIGNWINPEQSIRAVGSLMGGMTVIAEKAAKEEEKEPALVTAIKNLGEHLKNLIVTTIPGFIQDAWTAIGNLGGQIWKGIQYAFNGDIEPGESESAITKIAFKIAHFIRTKLPKKVVSIWKSIKIFGVDLYKGISNAFTGAPADNDRQEAITNIVNNIRSIIDDAIEAVKNLFKGPEKEDIGPIALPFDSKETKKMLGKMRKETEAGAKESEKSGFWTFIDTIKNSILSAFSNLGPAILNGLATALDFLGKIAVLIINVLTGDTDIGKEVNKAYNEEKPELKAALIKIGESLRTFFLETLPYFIGSAIGMLVKEAPGWFDKLFEGLNKGMEKSAEDAEKESETPGTVEQAVDNVVNTMGLVRKILDAVGGLIGGFGFNADIVSAIAIILALSLLFSRMSDLFSVADELEEGARLVKWTAITIAISAIAGLLAWITKTIDEDAENLAKDEKYVTKIDRLMKVLDSFKEFFDKILWIIGIIAAKDVATGALDLASTISSNKSGNKGDKSFGSKLGDAFIKILEKAGLTAIGQISFAMIITEIEQAFQDLGETFLLLSSYIDDSFTFIEPFIDRCVSINEKMSTAIDTMDQLGTIFYKLYHAFDELLEESNYFQEKNRNSTDLEALSMQEYYDNLWNRIQLFDSLAVFIDHIASALSKFDNLADANKTLNEMSSVLTGGSFGSFLTTMLNVLKVSYDESNLSAKALGVTDYMVPKYTVGLATGLDVLSSAFSIFADCVSGFEDSKISAFEHALDVFDKLAEAFTKTSLKQGWADKFLHGDLGLSAMGTEIKLFGYGIKEFYKYIQDIEGVNENGLDKNTEQKLNGAIAIANTMDEKIEISTTKEDIEKWGIAGQSISSFGVGIKSFYESVQSFKGFGDDEEIAQTEKRVAAALNIADTMNRLILTSMGSYSSEYFLNTINEKLPSFGDAVSQFFTRISTAFTEEMTIDRSTALVNAVNATALLLSSFKDLASFTEDSGKDISEVLENIFSDTTSNLNATKLAALIKVFDDAILQVIESPNFAEQYKQNGSTIAHALFEGIQAAFDEDPELRIKITPVLNMNDTVKKNLREQLAGSYGFDGTKLAEDTFGINNQTDAERVTKTIFEQKFNETIEAIKSGPDNAIKATDLITAFASMRMVFDTGAMAGELAAPIDQMIGTKIWQLLRGNASAP